MKRPSVADVSRVYQYVLDPLICRHRIAFRELGDFSRSLNSLYSHIGEEADEEYWQTYFRELRRLRFELCAAPALNQYRDDRVGAIISTLSSHLKNCRALYPASAEPANALLHLLKAIQVVDKNPLLDKLVELAQSELKTAWAIKDSRLVVRCEEVLDSYPSLKNNLQIVHPSQLTSATCYDALVVIGSPRWFPAYIFTSPRAPRIDIVHFDWMHDGWKVPNTFVENYTSSRADKAPVREFGEQPEPDIPEETILVNVDSRRVSSIAAEGERFEYDDIDARCIVFEADTAMFVAADRSATILVIDLEEHEDERVHTIEVDELTPGTFVLVRTSGGGDYIAPIADQLMGDKAEWARSVQSDWKTRLREYVVKNGLLKTSLDLLDIGSEIANETNVRNWMSPRNIRTRDEHDFRAIMSLIGIEDRSREIWQTMKLISNAHRSAGRQLTKRLLGLIDEIPANEFKRNGMVELRLADNDEDAKLTAFRVEEILPETFKVPYSRISVPFKLEK